MVYGNCTKHFRINVGFVHVNLTYTVSISLTMLVNVHLLPVALSVRGSKVPVIAILTAKIVFVALIAKGSKHYIDVKVKPVLLICTENAFVITRDHSRSAL